MRLVHSGEASAQLSKLSLLSGPVTSVRRVTQRVEFVLLARDEVAPLAQSIDGAVSRDRDQPCHRSAERGIETGRLLPHAEKHVLQNLLRDRPVFDDTQNDAEKFRGRPVVEQREGAPVAPAHRGENVDEVVGIGGHAGSGKVVLSDIAGPAPGVTVRWPGAAGSG